MTARVSESADQSDLIATVVEALQMLADVASNNNVSELRKVISEIDRELSDAYHYIASIIFDDLCGLTIYRHGHIICNPEDFFHLVGNINNSATRIFQFFNYPEKMLHFLLI